VVYFFGPLCTLNEYNDDDDDDDDDVWTGHCEYRYLSPIDGIFNALLPTSCDRAFSASGPRVWNYLPTDLMQLSYDVGMQSLNTFYLDSETTALRKSVFYCTG